MLAQTANKNYNNNNNSNNKNKSNKKNNFNLMMKVMIIHHIIVKMLKQNILLIHKQVILKIN